MISHTSRAAALLRARHDNVPRGVGDTHSIFAAQGGVRKLQCGTVRINTHIRLVHEPSPSGYKHSGYG